MTRKSLALGLSVALLLASGGAFADDGERVLKRMTGGSINNQLNVLPEDVGLDLSEAEHAFTGLMEFYVPSQAADGSLVPIEYYDIDGGLVETLEVAKPLANVFIYGPAAEVEGTAFAHSWMEAFGAISLDDGNTWKTINLSESADQSSFTLGMESGMGDGGGGGSCADDPEGGGCGGHGGVTAELESATWTALGTSLGRLTVTGTTDPRKIVRIVNADTSQQLLLARSNRTTGEFTATGTINVAEAPCRVAALVDGVLTGPFAVTYPDGLEISCKGLDIVEYPGGVYNVVHAVAGNKVLVAWPSRYCSQGQPAYSYAWDGDDEGLSSDQLAKRAAVVAELGIDVDEDLYLTDLFGVAGQQRSSDFAEEGFPQIGEVPFGCLWTARGVLRAGDDPRTDAVEASHVVWTKAERLTSGRRDVNRVEVAGVKGAGFVITWQEDPEGLRPGQGEGPGEGFSGAIAHSQTDIWYSFVPWSKFDLVENPDDPTGAAVNIADHDLEATGRPQYYIPFAVPMRLTNNGKCVPGVTTERFSYCNDDVAAAYGFQDFCADTVEVPQGQSGALGEICVNDDGLPNLANTASTRARTSLQGYDSDEDGTIDRAWVIVATEESKGLGRFAFTPDGSPCDEDTAAPEDRCEADIGKNQWYFSFDMGDPQTSLTADHPNGLVQNLVTQGNMLNQPEIDWATGEFYPAINTSEMWDFGSYNYDLYNTEIARRSSMLVQSIAKGQVSQSGLVAISSYKQGVMRQGGPADTMFRRFLIPDGFEQGIDTNPYSFEFMECEPVGGSGGWILTDGSNPYYPGGICLAPATNLSGTIPDTCIDTDGGAAIDCPGVDFSSSTFGTLDFPQNPGGPILQGFLQGEGDTTKLLTWHQCPSDGTQISGDFTAVTCSTDDRTDVFANLKDQSWYNPLDISKGHRGFLDGDFVMFLHAWSPNWRLNAKGSDRYDLYIRRSFDGGETWTTTPSSGTATDGLAYGGNGTVSCQTYRTDETGTSMADEPQVCYAYPAGGAEEARNVTQHRRMRVTTLDPRYSATLASIGPGCVDDTDPTIDTGVMTCDDTSAFDSDVRDASRYFIVYETGDNTTVEEGEAEPLDLFYGRGESFGDDYTVWAETDTTSGDASLCYPSDPHGDEDVSPVVEGSGFCNEFDRLTAGSGVSGSEASLKANPDGSKLYGVWAQTNSEDEEVVESEAVARRVWWIDDFIPSPENSWTLPGTNQQQ